MTDPVRTSLSSRKDTWVVRLLSVLTAVGGLINVSSAIQPALSERLAVLQRVLPMPLLHGSRIIVAVAGFVLLLLAEGLHRRKRVAWYWALATLCISLAAHLAKGLDVEEALFNLLLILLLLLFARSFFARPDQDSLRWGLLVLLGAVIFTLAYGTVGFLILGRHFSQPTLSTAFLQTVYLFLSPGSSLLEPLSQHGHFFKQSVVFIGLGAFLVAMISMLRPVLHVLKGDAAQQERAKEIIAEHGRTALCRALLFDDKSYFFSGQSLIAYALSSGTAVVLGDPVGPQEEIITVLGRFKDYCATQAWQPLFVSVLPDNLEIYKQYGWESLLIGYEAMIPLESFGLEGSRRKDLRNASSRLQRLGFSTKVVLPPHPKELLAELREVSDAWLRDRKLEELHYSDGAFDEAYLSEGPLALVLNPSGTAVAFANLINADKGKLISIDLMRHLPSPEHGTMEALFIAALQWAREQGAETFSLGLSAVAGVGEKPDDPRIERALHTLADHLKTYFNFSGLRVFKAKFNPDWQPRYLIFPGLNHLPSAVAALISVHSQRSILGEALESVVPHPKK